MVAKSFHHPGDVFLLPGEKHLNCTAGPVEDLNPW